MKCPVCNNTFNGGECPRCRFPVIESTDVDALKEVLQPMVEKYRREFCDGISFGVLTYYWKEENDEIVLDREEEAVLGSYSELSGGEKMLPIQFARIIDTETIDLKVKIAVNGQSEIRTVTVANLNEPALQMIGIEVNTDYHFRMLLKNSKGSQSVSEWQPILGE